MSTSKKNSFLDKIKQEKLQCIRAGMDTAWQEYWDLMCLVLHDPDVMGKDTFGKERLLKIRKAIEEREDFYAKALNSGPEADYYQEKMDAELRGIFGENVAPFKDRYPYVPQLDYTKQHRQWKDLF